MFVHNHYKVQNIHLFRSFGGYNERGSDFNVKFCVKLNNYISLHSHDAIGMQ